MGSTAAAKPQPEQANTTEAQSPITKGQIKQALWVAFCGALGGVLFWVLGKWSGTATFAYWKWYGQILALAFLGGMAALFGVFLLTASNLNVLKTYIFAIICGVVWQPIINTAIKSYSNVGVTRQVAQVSSQTDQLNSSADHGSQEQVQSAVKATVPVVTQALKQFPDVQDADKKQAIVDSSDKALVALQAAAAKAPDTSIQAIKEVGIAASEGNHADVGIHAIHSLREIGMAGARSNHPEVAKATLDSLQTLALSGKDPALKSAAAASVKEIEAEIKK
ncbi:MAG TPA: hypothetical protein VFF39_10805 [Verrucomicrobiae bacterium]|jgi:hypothetical protein|nr:hypothetical protein [Verrucomicrobiae bacterium]